MQVVVVGGSGYVGKRLVTRLLADRARVVVVGRDATTARIVLDSLFPRVTFTTFTQLLSESHFRGTETAAVINLAQVKDAPFYRLARENKGLIESVHRACETLECQRLIHVSSIAVCGFPLAAEPRATRMPMRLGNAYIEAKVQAEHALERRSRNARYALSIVRLGNVLGPGSPGWTAGIAQRILEGDPVAFEGEIGLSNATEVSNVADYLVRLASRSTAELRDFGPYHHLAEYASHTWGPILDTLADAVDKQWLAVPRAATSLSGDRWISRATRLQSSVIGGYARVMLGYVGGRPWADRWLGKLSESKKAASFGFSPDAQSVGGDNLLAETVATRFAFHSHALGAWAAPISFQEALDRLGEWTATAGYRYQWKE